MAAKIIQAAFRSWISRESLDEEHFCATEIQRIVRGNLCAMNYQDDLCSIIIAQSVFRRYFAINRSIRKVTTITQIQAAYRGYRAHAEYDLLYYESIVIQSAWRRHAEQLRYQFDLVDIIIVQCIARLWKARRILKLKLNRSHQEKTILIQEKLRSYYHSMKYLNTISHVIIVKSVVRRWSEFWKVEDMRFERDTIFVQSNILRWLAFL